jgi:hypothetical protein
MEPTRRICASSKWLVFKMLMRPLLAGFERPLTEIRQIDPNDTDLESEPVSIARGEPPAL